MNRLNILAGPVPVVLAVLGATALSYLAYAHRRRLVRAVTVSVVLAVLSTIAFKYLAEEVWELWEPTDRQLYYFIGVAVLGVLLAMALVVISRRRFERVLGAVCAVVVSSRPGGTSTSTSAAIPRSEASSVTSTPQSGDCLRRRRSGKGS